MPSSGSLLGGTASERGSHICSLGSIKCSLKAFGSGNPFSHRGHWNSWESLAWRWCLVMCCLSRDQWNPSVGPWLTYCRSERLFHCPCAQCQLSLTLKRAGLRVLNGQGSVVVVVFACGTSTTGAALAGASVMTSPSSIFGASPIRRLSLFCFWLCRSPHASSGHGWIDLEAGAGVSCETLSGMGSPFDGLLASFVVEALAIPSRHVDTASQTFKAAEDLSAPMPMPSSRIMVEIRETRLRPASAGGPSDGRTGSFLLISGTGTSLRRGNCSDWRYSGEGGGFESR